MWGSWITYFWSSLQQADASVRVGAQSVGQDAAGRAGADDNVVEFHLCGPRLVARRTVEFSVVVVGALLAYYDHFLTFCDNRLPQ